MKKKEEVTITFYAAECGEFHDLGEYTKCRTLEEAYKKLSLLLLFSSL